MRIRKLLVATVCVAGGMRAAHADSCSDSLTGDYVAKAEDGVTFRVLKNDKNLAFQSGGDGGKWGMILPMIALEKADIAEIVTDKKLARQSCAYIIKGFGGLLKLPKKATYTLRNKTQTSETGYVLDIEVYVSHVGDIYNVTQGDTPRSEVESAR